MFIILRCAEKHIKKCLKNMSKSLILIKLRFRLLTIPQILPPITPRIYNFIIGDKIKEMKKRIKGRRIGGKSARKKADKMANKNIRGKIRNRRCMRQKQEKRGYIQFCLCCSIYAAHCTFSEP